MREALRFYMLCNFTEVLAYWIKRSAKRAQEALKEHKKRASYLLLAWSLTGSLSWPLLKKEVIEKS